MIDISQLPEWAKIEVKKEDLDVVTDADLIQHPIKSAVMDNTIAARDPETG